MQQIACDVKPVWAQVLYADFDEADAGADLVDTSAASSSGSGPLGTPVPVASLGLSCVCSFSLVLKCSWAW